VKNILKLILGFLILQSCNDPSPESTSYNDLEGRWKFIAVERRIDGKWITDSWMQGGIGYLIYNAKGHMALHITTKGYEETEIIWDQDSLKYSSWPIFELIIEETGLYTLSNHVFTGNYSVSGDTLTHERVTHSNPAYFNHTIQRRYNIYSDTLTIYPPVVNSKVRVRWIRND